jgi:hypothetical protein
MGIEVASRSHRADRSARVGDGRSSGRSDLLLIRFAQQDHYPWWFGSSPTTSGWGVLKDADKQERS